MRQKLAGFTQLFNADRLSLAVLALIFFVAIIVASYAVRYLKGDSRQKAFFGNLLVLVLSVSVMVCADHILLFLFSWATSNVLLARLMLHKRVWEAAKQSSIIALKNFALGFVFLGTALLLLYNVTGQTSIQAIVSKPLAFKWAVSAGLLLLIAAMTQSALWPFHRWLTSSLNSPTPVSAIMHAGLVNGGGFLLARFAPMLAAHAGVLNLIFIAGIATAVLGTLWKLMQSDIKRMLACSTMGQMGFMIAQCGLGLFPAAVAHLCWHGLFKAYLFLGLGSAAKEKRLDLDYPPSLTQFLLSLVLGAASAYMFCVSSGKQILATDTTSFLMFLSMLAGAQFALPIIRGKAKVKLLLAAITTAAMGLLYGLSVNLIEHVLAPLHLMAPQPLNVLHLIAAALLLFSWMAMLFISPSSKQTVYPGWVLKKYVQMLNASQPHPSTITAHRNKYQF